jgi:hypothetical protein
MSKKQLNMDTYLLSKDETAHAHRLAQYENQMKSGAINNSLIGTLVHSLILKNLTDKAHQERQENKTRQAAMFEKFHNDRFNEKKYLEMMKAKLEERKEGREFAKEQRQHAYDETKERRQHVRDIEKAKATTAISHEAAHKDKVKDAIAKSFENPADALRYMLDPEGSANKVETFDSNSFAKKVWGKVKEKIGGAYTPKIKTRLKE